MSDRKRKKSLIDRAEDSALEHIPDKYQKSVVGVYRFGHHLNIIGVFGAIVAVFAAIGCCFLADKPDVNLLIVNLVLLAVMFGMSILGTRYLKFKMNPPSAFGWAIFIGIISLIVTGFFGLVLFASMLTDLAPFYGQATMAVIQFIYAALTLVSLVIAIDAIFYLFIAHKDYAKWYAGFAKRNHLGKEAQVIKKPTAPKEDCDEDL